MVARSFGNRQGHRGGELLGGLALGAFSLHALSWLSWIGDLIALGLPIVTLLTALILVGVLVSRQPRLVAWSLAGLVVAAGVGVWLPRLPQPTGPPTRSVELTAANLHFGSSEPAGGVTSALQPKPDILVVSELTAATDTRLRAEFESRIVDEKALRRFNYTEGLYSSVPLTQLPVYAARGPQALRLQVEGPKPFIVYAVHLPRPTLN